MANTIIELRHSYVASAVPSSLANGEIAINTYDGKFFYRGGVSNTIQTIQNFQGPAGLNQEIQFNDSGVLGADSGLSYNKTTDILTVVGGATIGGMNVVPQIQLSFNHANSAFAFANTISGGSAIDNVARSLANTAQITATAAFAHANAGFAQANTDFTNITISPSQTYGNTTHFPIITLSANGRINAISTVAATATDPSAIAFAIALG